MPLLQVDVEDACDVLAHLAPTDLVERFVSNKTGEWMYVFKPSVGEVVIYVKVVLRADCVVISFHEEERFMAMKTIRKSEAGKKRGSVLPDDACPECGTPMREKMGKLKLAVNGEEIAVTESPHLRCPKCHEVVLRFDDARKLRERALEIYRRKYRLLSADEIRSIRERFHLTQAELARLLRLGANTISRWEAARNVQTAAMDMLLRMIRDLPGSLDYLRKYAA